MKESRSGTRFVNIDYRSGRRNPSLGSNKEGPNKEKECVRHSESRSNLVETKVLGRDRMDTPVQETIVVSRLMEGENERKTITGRGTGGTKVRPENIR